MPAGSFQIGGWKWTPHNGQAVIKYVSAAEIQDVKAAGKDDARRTYLGRKTGEIDITLTWKLDNDPNDPTVYGPIHSYNTGMMADISPRGPNAGASWDWVEDDQDEHDAHAIQVERLETTRPPGEGKRIAIIKCSTWTAPKPQPVVTATATTPEPWSPGPKKDPPPGSPPKGFAATPVEVKP